jgi:glycosyltransferase involved in cell wall biosynthesis
MRGEGLATSNLRVTWVIATLTSGGIVPVCRYAAEAVTQVSGWSATVMALHEPVGERTDTATGVHYISLGLGENASHGFLQWLHANPQDIVITSDVSHIEASFPYIPKETLHVIQVHDSLRRYRDVAIRNHRWVDGVCCVARHIGAPLQDSLRQAGFRGLVDIVHNGAAFPAAIVRMPYSGPIRLLFMGRLDPFKGIFDLVPILQRLNKMNMPVHLTIVGGHHELLERRFKEKKLDQLVTCMGMVAHEDCYRLASESDVFLMLSRKEPFGMVTIEAMSMGCVPLACDIPSGSSEIIEPGKSGLLLPHGDFTAWAQAIKSLHEDRDLWRRLSEGAVQRARTEFNSMTMGGRLCKFLKNVKTHSKNHPAERWLGRPPEMVNVAAKGRFNYQRLPPRFREWVRNTVGSSPHLSSWWLNR